MPLSVGDVVLTNVPAGVDGIDQAEHQPEREDDKNNLAFGDFFVFPTEQEGEYKHHRRKKEQKELIGRRKQILPLRKDIQNRPEKAKKQKKGIAVL